MCCFLTLILIRINIAFTMLAVIQFKFKINEILAIKFASPTPGWQFVIFLTNIYHNHKA